MSLSIAYSKKYVVQYFFSVPTELSSNVLHLNLTSNPNQGAVLYISVDDLPKANPIRYYAVMISELDCQPEPIPQRKLWNISENWPLVNSWHDVQNDVCQRQYQATQTRHAEGLSKIWSREATRLEIEIGTDKCSNDGSQAFCNGPLRAGARYAIVFRSFSLSGFTDSGFVVLETISEIRLSLIILLIIAILASSFFLGIVIVLRKRNRGVPKECLTEPSGKPRSSLEGVLTKNFPEHFDDLSKNNCERLNMEFNVINSGQVQTPCYDFAKLNVDKNRYTNVLPCKLNRFIIVNWIFLCASNLSNA